MGLKGQIKFGSQVYNKTILKDSLLLLKEIAREAQTCQRKSDRKLCQDQLNQLINANFVVYRPIPHSKEPGYRKSTTTKFTSYYSPDFNGSRVPTSRFKRAIFKLPSNSVDREQKRVDIDYHNALAGKGLELFWVEESFFDLYLLHVQGGGRIKIHNPDGSMETKYLSYAGKNAQTFKMIYHHLVGRGYLKPDEASVPNQRKFLQENPGKEEEVFGSCPSYVYFKESIEEPVGVNNIPLTEGRSLAIDNTIYKTMGLINFVRTVKATRTDANGKVVKEAFSRFFISQDTGGAIRGNARCDLYMGYGPLAELAAYNMNELGEQYFLIKKEARFR